MGEDESEQPLTEHLVDQFASYFLITMVAFHLVGYMKKHYEKRQVRRCIVRQGIVTTAKVANAVAMTFRYYPNPMIDF